MLPISRAGGRTRKAEDLQLSGLPAFASLPPRVPFGAAVGSPSEGTEARDSGSKVPAPMSPGGRWGDRPPPDGARTVADASVRDHCRDRDVRADAPPNAPPEATRWNSESCSAAFHDLSVWFRVATCCTSGVSSTGSLFEDRADLLHSTSAIRYPVFVKGNYTGHRPRPLDHPVLAAFVEERLAPDLVNVDEALIVPLGQAVEGCLDGLVKAGHLDPARCLFGFPHSSGANASRARQFSSGKTSFSKRYARRSLEGDLRCSRPRVVPGAPKCRYGALGGARIATSPRGEKARRDLAGGQPARRVRGHGRAHAGGPTVTTSPKPLDRCWLALPPTCGLAVLTIAAQGTSLPERAAVMRGKRGKR
jgi:hypothetical protein